MTAVIPKQMKYNINRIMCPHFWVALEPFCFQNPTRSGVSFCKDPRCETPGLQNFRLQSKVYNRPETP